MPDPAPLQPRHPVGPRLAAAGDVTPDQPRPAGRGVPVIGTVGAGGVVTFHPGGEAWMEAARARAGRPRLR